MAKFTINKDFFVGDTNYSLEDIPFGVEPEVPSNQNYFKFGNMMICWGWRNVTLNWNGNGAYADFNLANDGTPYKDTAYRIVGSYAGSTAYYAGNWCWFESKGTTSARVNCWCEQANKPTAIIIGFIAIGRWRDAE